MRDRGVGGGDGDDGAWDGWGKGQVDMGNRRRLIVCNTCGVLQFQSSSDQIASHCLGSIPQPQKSLVLSSMCLETSGYARDIGESIQLGGG